MPETKLPEWLAEIEERNTHPDVYMCDREGSRRLLDLAKAQHEALEDYERRLCAESAKYQRAQRLWEGKS